MSATASADPTGRYKGRNYDPNYRGGKKYGGPKRSGPPSDRPPPPPWADDGRPPRNDYRHSRDSELHGRPPWEGRERHHERSDGGPLSRPPWEERERRRSPRPAPSPVLRESRLKDPAYPTTSASNGSFHPPRGDERENPLLQPKSSSQPSLASDISKPVTLQIKSHSSNALEQTASDSGEQTSLDSLAKLQQFKAEVEASRKRRATTEVEQNKLALMAQSFLLAQQQAEPGELIEPGAVAAEVEKQIANDQVEEKKREQELKAKLLRGKQSDVIGSSPTALVKRERVDDPKPVEHVHKRPKAEDIGMDGPSPVEKASRLNDENRSDGKGQAPNYRPSVKNFVPERFRGASQEEAQRRAATSVNASERGESRRKPDDRAPLEDVRTLQRDPNPSEGRSLRE